MTTKAALNAKAARWNELNAQIKGLTDELDEIKAFFADYLAKSADGSTKASVETTAGKVLYSMVERTTFDSKRFKQEHPDLYAEYTKSTTYEQTKLSR